MTSHQASCPLASNWTAEKNACVDWSSPEDALCNGFTLLQLLEMHPKLATHLNARKEEKQSLKTVFLSPQQHDAQVAALQQWHSAGLLSERAERWCRYCGKKGHTRLGCSVRETETAAGAVADVEAASEATVTGSQVKKPVFSVIAKFHAHQQHLERLKLLEEKKRHLEMSSTGKSIGRPQQQQQRWQNQKQQQHQRRGGGRPGAQSPSRPNRDLQLFSEERRRGIVGRMDTQYNIGFVRVADVGDIKFFIDRVDYGVKEVAVGDAVTLKVDHSRDYPLAVDVRPERPVVSLDDAMRFVNRCRTCRQPVTVLAMLLAHQHEWYEVLRLVRSTARTESTAYVRGVHTLIELITFTGNRDPIHLNVLQEFLRMTISRPPQRQQADASGTVPASAVVPTANEPVGDRFFPDMVLAALEVQLRSLNDLVSSAASQSPPPPPPQQQQQLQPQVHLAAMVDQWVEVVVFIVLLRQYTDISVETIAPLRDAIEGFARQYTPSVPAVHQYKMEVAVRKLHKATAARALMELIPTAAEFAVPVPNPDSPFFSTNLPVSGQKVYTNTEEFVEDQCRLLRADTFEAVSRLLPAACFKLLGWEPTASTISDLEHACVYDHVRFMGEVITRDKDFSNPLSYMFQVKPRSNKANLRAHLHQGTTVCFSTGLYPTVMDARELFWGVVTSCDATLMKAGVIVVSPCESSAPFSKLIESLDRNVKGDKLTSSVLLETPIFIAGYMGIMKALYAFTGPLAMSLPLARHIVGPQAVSATSGGDGFAKSASAVRDGSHLIGYIPPHCEFAFRELADGMRSRFSLDAGQDAVVSRLPTSEVLLVQGPPGTGKSFIGCRVVETYVRYKQLVASGDILQKVSIDMLTSTRPEDLLPHVGPVVVITYKNHALDEFLVDLLDSGLWDNPRPRVGQQLAAGAAAALATSTTAATAGGSKNAADGFPNGRRLLRIGGRSKESRLAPHNLNSLLHSVTDKSAINSMKERIYVLNQRLERLTKEVQYLEAGRVPRSYFERWLTPEQRRHISFEERDAWLRGEKYIGIANTTVDARTDVLQLLQTQVAFAMSSNGASATTVAGGGDAADGVALQKQQQQEEESINEDVSLSVFQEMKMEDESREFNDHLHSTYLSAEAIHLAQFPPVRPPSVPEDLQSLWSLDPVTRHRYYAYLIQAAISLKARDCLMIMDAICSAVTIRNHAIEEAKLSLLMGADVIGLTTTGCAMNQNLLRSLRPSVLVVEEAAEVLESQLLACMTDSLQQIVLIGDHYQLKPKVETFEYEKVNHLNLSLFERLARHIKPICLTEQRRMHPIIAALVRPFYDTQVLLDHPLLSTRPLLTASGTEYVDHVPGLAKRVFFWRHHHPEEEAPTSRSKINTREIRMVQQIVSHLTAEGVMQKSVTVITPYLGQCRMLRSVMRLASLPDVRVSTVDMYQGDENDIIILSLVRTEKLTEFIRMRNRLIVSCSRARFGMVIVGNDKLLRQSPHWMQVLDSLTAQGCVGHELPITFSSMPGVVKMMQVHGVTSARALEQSFEEDTVHAAAAVEQEEEGATAAGSS